MATVKGVTRKELDNLLEKADRLEGIDPKQRAFEDGMKKTPTFQGGAVMHGVVIL